MKTAKTWISGAVAALLCAGMAAHAWADETVDTNGKPLNPTQIKNGLFPNDECNQLKAAGFKCMGFKPAVKFSLPAASFAVGSSTLPDALRQQLDSFAAALKARKPDQGKVRIEGHADASGTPEANMQLSQRRADAAKAYLVAKGVDPDLLVAVGVGEQGLKDPKDPTAAVNRRVVIGRDHEAN